MWYLACGLGSLLGKVIQFLKGSLKNAGLRFELQLRMNAELKLCCKRSGNWGWTIKGPHTTDMRHCDVIAGNLMTQECPCSRSPAKLIAKP